MVAQEVTKEDFVEVTVQVLTLEDVVEAHREPTANKLAASY